MADMVKRKGFERVEAESKEEKKFNFFQKPRKRKHGTRLGGGGRALSRLEIGFIICYPETT
jgi:hypothetical protein